MSHLDDQSGPAVTFDYYPAEYDGNEDISGGLMLACALIFAAFAALIVLGWYLLWMISPIH